jgi:hypothetical protein
VKRLLLTCALLTASMNAGLASAAVRWFQSPSGNIACEVSAGGGRPTEASCQTFHRPQSATLGANGRTRLCSGVRCLGNPPENSIRLAYGASVRVGPFRCTSRSDGVRCIVVRSGHGFLINRDRIARF